MVGLREIGAIAAAAFMLALGGCATQARPLKEIAFTFDDAPLPDGPYFTGHERARRIIAVLRAARVQAMFFVNPGRPERDRDARYHAYAAAGHIIANHTWDHPNLAQTSVADYVANVERADRALRPLLGFGPWFRYPYLSEGETVAKRDAVRMALMRLGYAQGYVTADGYDWYLDQLTRNAVAGGQRLDRRALRDLYVQSALDGANYIDRMARATLDRSPRQVLLMHENDLEALFLPDLIRALRNDGWRIISPVEAYADPIAGELPDTLSLGQGRIAALVYAHHLEGRFSERRANFTALDEPFAARVVKTRR
ncbi:MAG TPA: polysaccharide deacetylase family protein [Caulobacterales bacterium]|nr:polysaccharide deacetylase family protein [Caulobacterales bacterium]